MTAGLHVGAQVCISRGGESLADFAMGWARDGYLLRPDHRILWMSAGKPLVAVAFARLWEEKRLSPEDTVAAHIPEFAANGKDMITLRHLLTHTSAYKPPLIDWPRLPWPDIIDRICAARIPEGQIPGEYAAYDPQTGWYLLAETIQRITKVRYFDFIRQTILLPLGCSKSSFGMEVREYHGFLASDKLALLHDTTQTAREGKLLAGGLAPRWVADDEARAASHNPGGGALGPVSELRMFYEMLLNGGKAGGTTILQPSTIQEITKRVRAGLMDQSFKHRADWGLGFIMNSARYGSYSVPYGYGKHASEDTFGHGGMQSTVAYADPAHGLSVAATFNGLPGEPKHNKRAHDFSTKLYEELGLCP
jgi:CubicO group peptidase (beta-lactamase class C family)